MQFEWDDKKNDENIRKHGIDFADAWEVFQNPLLSKLDDSQDYDEDRWIGIGSMLNGVIVVIVFVEREPNTIRIISMRKATKRESKNYEQAIKNRLGKN